LLPQIGPPLLVLLALEDARNLTLAAGDELVKVAP
jgi:hypothetical protein